MVAVILQSLHDAVTKLSANLSPLCTRISRADPGYKAKPEIRTQNTSLLEKTLMPESRMAPYGSWKSPITSDTIASGSRGLSQPLIDGADIYWIEMRPTEGGRSVIV